MRYTHNQHTETTHFLRKKNKQMFKSSVTLLAITMITTVLLLTTLCIPSVTALPPLPGNDRIKSIANPPPYTTFRPDQTLQDKITALIKGFHGNVGVYVRHIESNTEAGVNHMATFPTASIVKIPILIGIHAKIAQGVLDLAQPYTYHESQSYPGSGLMQYFKDNTVVDIKTLVFMMISFSDNVASIINQELAGGGVEINAILKDYGFNSTFVNSRTPGREDEWSKWGWGQTTPYEMVNIITAIRDGVFVSPQLSQSMYRFLGNHFYDERSLSQISPYIKTGSKSGSLDSSRSEVVFVNNNSENGRGEYAFSIFTDNNRDQSWGPDNEAEELARQLSKMLAEYYGAGR